MISMTRQQQGDFNRCCDFLARMIENIHVLRDNIILTLSVKGAKIWQIIL